MLFYSAVCFGEVLRKFSLSLTSAEIFFGVPHISVILFVHRIVHVVLLVVVTVVVVVML